MIIQLLGANGAGKSTIVKDLIEGKTRHPLYFFSRGRPDAYELYDVLIAGHYEGRVCGGADTLPRHMVVECISSMQNYGKLHGPRPILIEGPTGREPSLLTVSEKLRVIHLRREVADNLEDWVQRNAAKGLSTNRAIMQRRIQAATTRCDKLVRNYMAAGITVTTTASRAAARAIIERILGRHE